MSDDGAMQLEVAAVDGPARATQLTTQHGIIDTPAFMPVGTHAAVTGMTPAMLRELGATILVSNAFRLAEKPGESVVRGHKGLHRFMGWDGAILTDSGGFQVYRVEDRIVREDGVEFPRARRGNDRWTPERALEVQVALGADLVMPLDVCVSLPAPHRAAEDAMTRTLRWAERSRHIELQPHQTLFGIIQGGTYPDLRRRCVDELEKMGFPGYAVGGLNVGESATEFRDTLATTTQLLPDAKPRYLMGVGRPLAMLEAVAAGVDLMDSIVPTKYAREGSLFTSRGPLNVRKPKLAKDRLAVDPSCGCYTCRTVSRSYLAHLFATTATTAQVFASIHNIYFCVDLMRQARQAIIEGRFEAFHDTFRGNYQKDTSPS